MAEKNLCFTEFLEYMIDEDHSAGYVIECMMQENKSHAILALNALDDKDIRGRKLYDFYAKDCDRKVGKLFEVLGVAR